MAVGDVTWALPPSLTELILNSGNKEGGEKNNRGREFGLGEDPGAFYPYHGY